MKDIKELLERIEPFDYQSETEAHKRWSHVAHPLHSLGLLEDAIAKIAGMTGSPAVNLKKKSVIIFCADNGIVEEGVTQTDSSVTASVTCGFTKGEGCVTLMAKQAGADCIPVDIGIANSMDGCGTKYPLVDKKIAYGTKNFMIQPAMTMEQVLEAIAIGVELVEKEKEKGTGLIAVGEMGIGNTTTSSALASVFLNKPVEDVTGKGAGLSNRGLEKKNKCHSVCHCTI